MAKLKFLLAAIAASAAFSAAASAQTGDTLAASYNVEIAKVRVMEIKHSVTFSGNTYEATFRAKSRGMMNLFSKLRLNLSSKGRLKDGAFIPAAFEFERKRNDDNNAYSLAWNDSGIANVVRDFKGDALKRLKAALAKGSRDPLAIILDSGLNGGAKPCTGTHRAYDGRDVYDMTFNPAGVGDGGKTIRCRISGVTVAGRDFEKSYPEPAPVFTYESVLKAVTLPGRERPVFIPTEVKGKVEGQTFRATIDGLAFNGERKAFD
jgi:hypothetical protein